MRILRFDQESGRPIELHGSTGAVISPVMRTSSAGNAVQVGCFYLAPGGFVGYHRSTVPQVFLVVQGEGWVRGESPGRVPIHAGRAAFWEGGEWHEAGTQTGLVAVVIEGDALQDSMRMVEG